MSTSAALHAVRKFRIKQLNDLIPNNRRFGYLPIPAGADPDAIHLRNPFLPVKNPRTGRWLPAPYSRRQQAELIKSAKAAGVLHLLPPGPKLPPSKLQVAVKEAAEKAAKAKRPQPEVWEAKVGWLGDVKENKVAAMSRLYAQRKRMFKGHKWERVKTRRLNYKTILLRDMDARIQRFKAHRKSKRPNPLSIPRQKRVKLPF
ncbi:hypothetical protein BDZ89DRAFT_1059428 [Hymenopellis radicata]|nr:hypothetical protein BDZ89DRAFT_1059428 [Hymenopellis radicata]